MIHIDSNDTNLIQPIPADSTNIGSIYDSANICAIEKILASPVHSLVNASLIFTYGSASDPPSPSHESPEESVTPKVITKSQDNPTNSVPYLPYDLDSDPSSQYSSSSESSDSSHESIKNKDSAKKKDKKKFFSKTR